jgi:predicted phage-related endonuclease
MSYARMGETEQRLKQEIEALLKQAEDVDAAEDAQYGKGKRGDELPEELARREEQERTGKKKRGREPIIPRPEQAQPEAKAQRNFT